MLRFPTLLAPIVVLNDLGLKHIQYLIDKETNTLVFKAPNGLAPEHLSDLFIRNPGSHLRPLRNTSTDLKLPKKTTNNNQRGFLYRGAKSWNAFYTLLYALMETSTRLYSFICFCGYLHPLVRLFMLFWEPQLACTVLFSFLGTSTPCNPREIKQTSPLQAYKVKLDQGFFLFLCQLLFSIYCKLLLYICVVNGRPLANQLRLKGHHPKIK